MTNTLFELAGSVTAIITPFRDGEVDEACLAALCERQIARGTTALVVCCQRRSKFPQKRRSKIPHFVRRPIGVVGATDHPNLAQVCAVLTAVKAASRRLRRWPAASLDRRCARRCGRLG